jgi:hypothetical protein
VTRIVSLRNSFLSEMIHRPSVFSVLNLYLGLGEKNTYHFLISQVLQMLVVELSYTPFMYSRIYWRDRLGICGMHLTQD